MPTDQMCFVPLGTVCMVADSQRRLKDYTTKRQNVFPTNNIVYGSGIVFSLNHKNALPIHVNASMLKDSGYITFRTENLDWPYIVLPSSLFSKIPKGAE